MTRFVVLELQGFLAPNEGHSQGREGLSASVYDQTWDRVVHTYRSEDTRWFGDIYARVRQLAREHAARLEAEYA